MQENPYSDLDDFLNQEAPVNPLDAFLDRELPAKEEDRRRAIPITRGSGIQTGSLITGKDDPATMAIKLGKSALSGLESGAADLGRTLDFYSTKLSELTGLPKGGIFGKLANDWDYWGNRLKGEGLQGVAGDIARGTGKAVGDVAQIMTLGGGPVGMAVHGAATGGTEGVKGAVTGGLGGALMGGALHGLGYLSRGAQVPAAVATGAITTPGSLEEKAKGGAEMGLLQLAGMRKTPEISPLAGIRAADVQAGELARLGPSVEQPDSVKIILDAIKRAEPIRAKQDKARAQEMAKRFERVRDVGEKVGGQAGYYAQLAELKGRAVKPTFEPIVDKAPQLIVDDLYNRIQNNSMLGEGQKISTKRGLSRILNGEIPPPNELGLLRETFGGEFADTMISKSEGVHKVKTEILNTVNILKSSMASGDLSFGFRQGILVAGRHPIIFWKNWAKQFELAGLGGESVYMEVNDKIARNEHYKLAQESGVAFTDIGKTLGTREEAFQSNRSEKIPFLGTVIRGSSRAYTGMANLTRMDLFSYLVKRAKNVGKDPYSDPDLARKIAGLTNHSTGRGGLGKLEKSAVELNAALFSPRLISSRIHFLFDPRTYIGGDKFVRHEAWKTILAFAGVQTTILGAAKLAGMKVGTDPRSADFGKIIIGKTRFDFMGGFAQYVRLAAQMITGKLVSSTTGKVSVLGEGYRPLNRLEILERMVQSKEAPVFSFATDILKGQGTFGKKLDIRDEIAERFIPMVIQDAKDIWDTDPSLFPASALGVFGAGMQTYVDAKPSDALLNHPSMTKFYEAKVAIESKNREFNEAVKAGDIPRAKAIRDKNPRITMAPAFNAIERSIAAYRKAIDQVAVNKDISKAEQDRRMKDLANKLLDFVEARKDLWGKN